MKKKEIKCCECGTKITGGFYNTPLGVYCCKCWGAKPKSAKALSFTDALIGLAAIGKILG